MNKCDILHKNCCKKGVGHSESFSNLIVIANVLILFLLIFFLYYIAKSPQVFTYPQLFAVNYIRLRNRLFPRDHLSNRIPMLNARWEQYSIVENGILRMESPQVNIKSVN